MNTKNTISCYAIIVAGLNLFSFTPAFSAIRVGSPNRTYSESYRKLNSTDNPGATNDNNFISQTQVQSGTVYSQNSTVTNYDNAQNLENTLPIRVADKALANQILNGDANAPVGVSDLTRCAAVYPNGEFEWSTPDAGTYANSGSTCVAVVEMRAERANPDGSDLVLARARIASGDPTVRCNISDFPESGYTKDVENFEFPADNEPTEADVIAVLNQEQKQNAVLKIAASALVGGALGNMSGKNEPGKDGVFGTGKEKMRNTLVGALGAAAVGTAGTYSGKVAGDTIMSTGINAAAGAVIGNTSASGDDVLRIEKLKDRDTKRESTCILGYVTDGKVVEKKEGDTCHSYYYDKDTGDSYDCSETPTSDAECATPVTKNCKKTYLINVKLPIDPNASSQTKKTMTIEELKKEDFASVEKDKRYTLKTNEATKSQNLEQSNTGNLIEIESAELPGKTTPAAICGENITEKMFGWTQKHWNDYKTKNPRSVVYARNTQNEIYKPVDSAEFTIDKFHPIKLSADTEQVLDLNNKARMKSTVIGAGAGGALGAISGYQGAKDDVQQRWIAELNNYTQSLNKVYCITGKRFLDKYNGPIVIPTMSNE